MINFGIRNKSAAVVEVEAQTI